MTEVIERLFGMGYDLLQYNRSMDLASPVGANRDYILNRIPRISKLMVESLDEVLAFGETLVFGNESEEFWSVPERMRLGQVVVDLVRSGFRHAEAMHAPTTAFAGRRA